MNQKKKSILERARDWWEMAQIKRRRHQSFWYIGWFILVVVTYSTMIGFGVFVQSNDDINSTKVGQSFVIGETNYTLLDKKLDESNRQAMIVFANPKASVTDLSKQLKASVEYLDSSGEKSSIAFLTGDKEYYVLVVSNLPEKWKAMKLVLKETGAEEKSTATILLSERKEKSQPFTLPNEKGVMIDSLNYQIKQKQVIIQEKKNVIQDNEKRLEENEEKRAKVKEEMTYQTETEKKASEGILQQLKDSDTGITDTNRTTEQEIKELENQISNVQDKIEDVQK